MIYFFRPFAFRVRFWVLNGTKTGQNPENPYEEQNWNGNLRLFSKQFRFFGKKIEKTHKNRNPFLKNPKRFHHKKTDCGF